MFGGGISDLLRDGELYFGSRIFRMKVVMIRNIMRGMICNVVILGVVVVVLCFVFCIL